MLEVSWFKREMWAVQTRCKGVEYCFLSENNEQCFPFFYCKEFLLDAVCGTIHNMSTDVYGFNYRITDPKVDLNRTRLMIRNKTDHDLTEHVENAIKFVNLMEDEFNFEKSELHKVKSYPAFAVFGDKAWMHAPPLLSLYSLLLRVGMGYESGSVWKYLKNVSVGKCNPICAVDSWYLEDTLFTIKRLAATKCSCFCKEREDNWPSNLDFYITHEYGGIVSFSKGYYHTRRYFPKWFGVKA